MYDGVYGYSIKDPNVNIYRTRTELMEDRLCEMQLGNHSDIVKIEKLEYQIIKHGIDLNDECPFISIGGGTRELVSFDPEVFNLEIKSSQLKNNEFNFIKKIFQKLDELLVGDAKLEDKLRIINQVCRGVFRSIDIDTTVAQWTFDNKSKIYNKTRKLEIPVIPLHTFLLQRAGVCRHTSLLNIAFLRYAIKRKFIDSGSLHVFRASIFNRQKKQSAHAWSIYKPNDNEFYIVDASLMQVIKITSNTAKTDLPYPYNQGFILTDMQTAYLTPEQDTQETQETISLEEYYEYEKALKSQKLETPLTRKLNHFKTAPPSFWYSIKDSEQSSDEKLNKLENVRQVDSLPLLP